MAGWLGKQCFFTCCKWAAPRHRELPSEERMNGGRACFHPLLAQVWRGWCADRHASECPDVCHGSKATGWRERGHADWKLALSRLVQGLEVLLTVDTRCHLARSQDGHEDARACSKYRPRPAYCWGAFQAPRQPALRLSLQASHWSEAVQTQRASRGKRKPIARSPAAR